jgi:hypothetical protein
MLTVKNNFGSKSSKDKYSVEPLHYLRGKPLRDYGVHSQGIPGIIWDYWNYMGLFGIIWDYVELYGIMWNYLGLFGICDHLE